MRKERKKKEKEGKLLNLRRYYVLQLLRGGSRGWVDCDLFLNLLFLPITFRSKYEGEKRRGEGGGGVCVRVCVGVLFKIWVGVGWR